jgi:hypothetical protein
LYAALLCMMCATCCTHVIIFDLVTQIIIGEEYCEVLYCPVFPVRCYCDPLKPISSSATYSQAPSVYVRSSVWETKVHTRIKEENCSSSVTFFSRIVSMLLSSSICDGIFFCFNSTNLEANLLPLEELNAFQLQVCLFFPVPMWRSTETFFKKLLNHSRRF